MKPEFIGGPFRPSWLLFPLAVLLGSIAVAAILFGLASKALAEPAPQPQMKCAPYVKVRDALKQAANETEVSFGIIDQQSVLTVFASPKGETWTALIVGASGMACVIAEGRDYFQTSVLKGEPV